MMQEWIRISYLDGISENERLAAEMEDIGVLLEEIRKNTQGYWPERIISQLGYAVRLSRSSGNIYDEAIADAVSFLSESFLENGSVTKEAAEMTEKMIYGLNGPAKKLKVICAAHAHIDMNWMWGFGETVAIALDTFRTMLNMMKEYPGFVFSQSQASVYRIAEEYDPEMLEEIRARIKDGRWEVTASSWVETDKNMPNGESLSRHILYTKRYLSELLDIDPDSLDIDFEPDTFGHNANVPEILCSGGVRYYYYCRGYDGYDMYRWQSQSGRSLIADREPAWYNAGIDPDMVMGAPDFCKRHNTDTVLKVYGVGDHGGGPTRRDIEKIIDMDTWPVFPKIAFGTFKEYFRSIEKLKDEMPTVKNELNFVFPGCYTTQTRIKTANRISEAKLYESETLSAISGIFTGGRYDRSGFVKAWEKTLFNHFHDILPGSGITETREYALGQFQQVMAQTNTQTGISIRHIASMIDTSIYGNEDEGTGSISEGAGAGYAIKDFGVPQTERGRGRKRIFHFFNPTAYERRETVELNVWDWPGSRERIVITDNDGKNAGHQIVEEISYWGHSCMKILTDAAVPSFGYSTYILDEKIPGNNSQDLRLGTRTEVCDEFVMENEYLKIIFDKRDISLRSFFDKKSGRELIDKDRKAGVFRLIDEDDTKGMTAWIVGRYMGIEVLNDRMTVKSAVMNSDALRQWICCRTSFRDSSLEVTVSLDKHGRELRYEAVCDWKETSEKGKGIPQLNFHVPIKYRCRSYLYDIPFGTVERKDMDMDVPANSWMLGMPEYDNGAALMLMTATKYGFRGTDDSLAIDLIRSSYDPDPYPEFGINKFRFALCAVDPELKSEMIKESVKYNHPIIFVSSSCHQGSLPSVNSFISFDTENVTVSCIKFPEDDIGNNKLIIRAYETEGVDAEVKVSFGREAAKAFYVDINERPVMSDLNISVEGKSLTFGIGEHCMASVCVEFK
jgi:alpha-mannosidase